MPKIKIVLLIIIIGIFLGGCQVDDYYYDKSKINIVTTTAIIADLARNIGQEKVHVYELMGPGIDPHSYNATAGDIRKIQQADLVIFNGLHLEGKMEKVFSNLDKIDKNYLEIGAHYTMDELIYLEDQAVDPHIWFSVTLWKKAATLVCEKLQDMDPENFDYYLDNKNKYFTQLNELDLFIREEISKIPEQSRVLITAHDAFNYFGREYGFEVIGLQGLSSLDEAGIKRISELAEFIVKREIKAIYIENSVPVKTMQALQKAVLSRGFNVKIGGELYSDSLGNKNTIEGTYIGAYKANIIAIVGGLKDE